MFLKLFQQKGPTVPIQLTLEEKYYLVALFGDITMANRERLFSISSFPPQAGPLVMKEGYNFLSHLNNGRIVVSPRKRRSNHSHRRPPLSGYLLSLINS